MMLWMITSRKEATAHDKIDCFWVFAFAYHECKHQFAFTHIFQIVLSDFNLVSLADRTCVGSCEFKKK
jgi:hypothetical protein